MENNLESQDIGRYCQSAENKHGAKKSYVVDITEVLPIFRSEVNQHHPILGDGEVFTLFKLGIEIHFIIYCMNNGYIDEHYMDVLTEEISHAESINLTKEEAEDVGAIYAGVYNRAFYYIHSFIPSGVKKTDLLPVRWEVFGNRLKIIINEYPELIKTLYEDI